MQKNVTKIVSLNFKNILMNGFVNQKAQKQKTEELFFSEYDKTFLMSDYIKNCIIQKQLIIPVDFSNECRFDDFAEDHFD
ncbi:unnamed protein product (macronuclear) [Paramecium tetraurelia]|uniref:Uncharacterized protein n=1 Tax=Paramecium tetraurelia TaxID=5888 RepID=A0C503_PARTE|nr:uncharacterized protein GSPATT00006369001 [Paramecium tetraurelia]CAK65870.1 unnamed protein product [Paramecium tetraurelia]|eukprot:XP_001433267.1 hypothetical protein (macronuclear) [Paramecium tetraurelia strain d4-2]